MLLVMHIEFLKIRFLIKAFFCVELRQMRKNIDIERRIKWLSSKINLQKGYFLPKFEVNTSESQFAR